MSRPPLYSGCRIEGCPRKHHAGGFCDAHYRADRRGVNGTGSASGVNVWGNDSFPGIRPLTAVSEGIRTDCRQLFLDGFCKDCDGPASYVLAYSRGFNGQIRVRLPFCGTCLYPGWDFIQKNIPARGLVVVAP